MNHNPQGRLKNGLWTKAKKFNERRIKKFLLQDKNVNVQYSIKIDYMYSNIVAIWQGKEDIFREK